MKKYYCDICKKEIKPVDIHIQLNVNIEDKPEYLDLHSVCYYKLLNVLEHQED